MGKVMESIFDGQSYIIPMADVQHIERQWYPDDQNKTRYNYTGILIITKHTHWNFEKDYWDNPVYLPKEEAQDFLDKWKHYRYELEKETINNDGKSNPLFFLCKCGHEIEGDKNTDEHQIVCPKCKRKGNVELQPF